MIARAELVAVERYARAVRVRLADLPRDDVEELTEGLEADLAAALADRWSGGPDAEPAEYGERVEGAASDAAPVPDLETIFGPVDAYAAELREAAGLAAPTGPSTVAGRAWLAARTPVRSARAAWRRVDAGVDAVPGAAAVLSFLRDLVPVGWVLRGWVLFEGLRMLMGEAADVTILPRTTSTWLLLGAFVLVSVQWGRGRWRVLPGLRRIGWVVPTATAASVLAALPVFANVRQSEQVYVGGDSGVVYINPYDGVWVDGMQVSNLFPYDAEGNPLSNVQLFDDRGRQVRTIPRATGQQPTWEVPGIGGPWGFVPTTDVDGRQRWNVYPLRAAAADALTYEPSEPGNYALAQGASPRVMPRPFERAPAAVVYPEVADATPQAAAPTPSPATAEATQ